MLRDLLRLLAESDGIHSVSTLARDLKVSDELVQLMIADLTRQGYLQPANNNCDYQCNSCPTRKMCTSRNTAKIWAVTQKGYSLINHDRGEFIYQAS